MSSALALARTCGRYWSTVAPVVRVQLARWHEHALKLRDPRRRALALAKLREERFNPQLAATLAVQARRAHRATATEAIVALQVLYDYLDALGEHTLDGDDEYARALADGTRAAVGRLEGWRQIAGVALVSCERWQQAQHRGHVALTDEQGLRDWAEHQARGSGLGWREWLAGAQGSVLCTHAMIALAADGRATVAQASALDRAYLSIGSLTMLDSLVDREERGGRVWGEGRSARELDYTRWYAGPEQMGERLASVARDVGVRAAGAPDEATRMVVLSGIVAYYASSPRVRDPEARAVFSAVRAELGRAFPATLALLRAWRLAKRARSLAVRLHARRRGVAAVGAATALLLLAAAGAFAARSLRARDEAHLRYVSASGSTLYETGRATGTLPGPMRVHMDIGATFLGSFTIYLVGGSISGHGSAVPHGAGVYESFAGTVTISGGSGRYRHAGGSARLYGTFDRDDYSLVIQTQGLLHY